MFVGLGNVDQLKRYKCYVYPCTYIPFGGYWVRMEATPLRKSTLGPSCGVLTYLVDALHSGSVGVWLAAIKIHYTFLYFWQKHSQSWQQNGIGKRKKL